MIVPVDPDRSAVLFRWFEQFRRSLLPPLSLHLVHSLEATYRTETCAEFCSRAVLQAHITGSCAEAEQMEECCVG